MRATCAEFSGFIRAGLKQFGTEEACVSVSAYMQAIGCPCIGGSKINECVVCEFGLQNPDFEMSALGTTCSVAREYVRQDVSNFGTENECNEVRMNATLSGCVCNDDPRESEEADLVKCVVCENGLSNPQLYVDAIEAQCSDAALFIEGNIAEYNTPSACEEGRLGLLELGCICNESNVLSEESTNSLYV